MEHLDAQELAPILAEKPTAPTPLSMARRAISRVEPIAPTLAERSFLSRADFDPLVRSAVGYLIQNDLRRPIISTPDVSELVTGSERVSDRDYHTIHEFVTADDRLASITKVEHHILGRDLEDTSWIEPDTLKRSTEMAVVELEAIGAPYGVPEILRIVRKGRRRLLNQEVLVITDHLRHSPIAPTLLEHEGLTHPSKRADDKHGKVTPPNNPVPRGMSNRDITNRLRELGMSGAKRRGRRP